MTRDVSLYLNDILSNMDDAMQYVQGMTFDQFAKDSKTIKAVIRSIEVIGEAVKKSSAGNPFPSTGCSLARYGPNTR
jgi:uncharacterized protein with HEPN domain